MGGSTDKRNFPRANVRIQVAVRSGEDRFSGQVLNLTVEGISFVLDRPLKPGSLVDLELMASDDRIGSNTLQAEILRCEAGEGQTPPSYQVSAKLIDANDRFLMDALALVHGRQT